MSSVENAIEQKDTKVTKGRREHGQVELQAKEFWSGTEQGLIPTFVTGADALPGFVVADVSVGGQLTLPQARGFLRKCEVLRHQKNNRPFLSMLVADHFAKDAISQIRDPGSMATTVRNLLGEEFAEALKSLVATLTNASAAIVQKPEIVHTLFSKLSAIEGAAANLRGPLFELIVGYCVGKKEPGTIEVQKTIREPGNQVLTDIDMLR